MRKRRIERVLAVAVSRLRNDGDDGEEDADEAVLEDAYPDGLFCDIR